MPLHSNIPMSDPDEDRQTPTPLVYVTENPVWEYKMIARGLDEVPDGIELNTLGKDGWELAAAVPLPDQVCFYFKRIGR